MSTYGITPPNFPPAPTGWSRNAPPPNLEAPTEPQDQVQLEQTAPTAAPGAPAPISSVDQQVRAIYAQIAAEDRRSSQEIFQADETQSITEQNADMANTANWSAAVYAGQANFMNIYIAPPPA